MKEYELIKEDVLHADGRYVSSEAIVWPDKPIPIFRQHNWNQVVGSIISLRREDNVLYGYSENFDKDVELAIELSNIQSVTHNGILYITRGILRAASFWE